MFLNVIDRVAPTEVFRHKQRTEPWINDDILRAI